MGGGGEENPCEVLLLLFSQSNYEGVTIDSVCDRMHASHHATEIEELGATSKGFGGKSNISDLSNSSSYYYIKGATKVLKILSKSRLGDGR